MLVFRVKLFQEISGFYYVEVRAAFLAKANESLREKRVLRHLFSKVVFVFNLVKEIIMSVNVMTNDEINEVSGADFMADSITWGGGLGALYGGALDGAGAMGFYGGIGLGAGTVFGLSYLGGSYVYDNYLANNPTFQSYSDSFFSWF